MISRKDVGVVKHAVLVSDCQVSSKRHFYTGLESFIATREERHFNQDFRRISGHFQVTFHDSWWLSKASVIKWTAGTLMRTRAVSSSVVEIVDLRDVTV